MKRILHVTGTYKKDGSTYSTILLHNYLKKQGYLSRVVFLSDNQTSSVKNINPTIRNKIIFFFLNKLNTFVVKILKKDKSFAFFNNSIGTGIIDIIKSENPDIVHFHWMPRSIRLSELKNIDKKIIWTVRDFWPFTGGCNVPINCNKFLTHCNNCPNLKTNFNNDLSYYNFKEKKNIYKFLKNITLTFPCSDFKNIYKKSILNKIKNFEIIPNALDESFKKFSPVKIKKQNYSIIFGAQNLDQEWKGTNIIIKIIEKLKKENIDFIIFGQTVKYKDYFNDNKKVKYMGYIESRYKLKKIFRKSNLFIFPSYYESFGKTIIESLACGIPIIANNKYGAKDIISHKKDGYLVNNQNINEYIKEIKYFKNLNSEVNQKCIKKSKTYYIDKIGKKFIDLYSKS